jgi:hypothetical protein
VKLFALIALALTATVAGAQPDPAFVPVRVNRADELYPVAGSGYLAWARRRPRGVGFDAFVARGHRRAIRVNHPGTWSIPGGSDGNRLAYVQWNIPDGWSLILRNLRTGGRLAIELTDNTQCLYQALGRPSISGNLVLYSSHTPAGASCVALYSLSTGRDLVLDRGGAFGATVTAGQVNGRFAVWTSGDGVHLYDIATRSTTVLPVDAQASGASVSRSGTVYVVHRLSSYPSCDCRLVRIPLGGVPEELGAPREHVGIGSTYALSLRDRTVVYFDAGSCSDADNSDIYAYVDRAG